nr:MAG TPA: terminase [Caudoviricetes sp.]
MREYQQKLIKSKCKIVLCNWNRGKGKTYSIIQKMLQKGGSWVFITPICTRKCDVIHKELEMYFREENICYREFKVSNNRIEIHFNKEFYLRDGVKDLYILFENADKFRFSPKVDYVVIDDYELNSRDEIRKVISEAKTIRGLEQIIITTSIDDFEYIDDKEIINIDKSKWIDSEINKLMNEFSNIPKEENTTKRRDIILNMIERLESMRGRR